MTSIERLRNVELIVREQKTRATEQLHSAIRVAVQLQTPAQWSEYMTLHRLQDMDLPTLEKHVDDLLKDLRAKASRLEPITTTLRIFDVHAHTMLQSEPAVRDRFVCDTWALAHAADAITFPSLSRVHFHAVRKAHDASTPLICQRACQHIGTGQTTKQAAADAVRIHMTQCCGVRLRSIQPPHKRMRLRLQQLTDRLESGDDEEEDETKTESKETRKRKRSSDVDLGSAPLEQYGMWVAFTPVFVMDTLLPRFGAALRRSPVHESGFAHLGNTSPATAVEREAKQLAPLCDHEFRDDAQCSQYRALRAYSDHATRCCKQPSAYMTMYRAILAKHLSPMSVVCCMRLAFGAK